MCCFFTMVKQALCVVFVVLLASFCIISTSLANSKSSALPGASSEGAQAASRARSFSDQKPIPPKDAAALQKFNGKLFAKKKTQFNDGARRTKVTFGKNATEVEPRQLTLFPDSGVSFSGSMPSGRKDNAIGPVRAPLPGNKFTLSQMDTSGTPEFGVAYDLKNGTKAKVAINPQDKNNPLYTPVEEGQKIGATELSLEVALDEALSLKLGAEYRRHEQSETRGIDSSTSQGASVGLSWSF